MKFKLVSALSAICVASVLGMAFHLARAQSATISFKIHNNQSDVSTLEIYDAGDKNHPHLIAKIQALKAGATTSGIVIAPISGAIVGRANWRWDGTETNGINVSDGKVYELSSGAER